MKRIVLTLLFLSLLYSLEAQICPTLSINSTSIACNGTPTGAATVNVSGGTTPYTYTWLPAGGNASVATNLSGGVYTVTVADGGTCVVTTTVNIQEPNFFLAVKSQTNLACFGGSGVATYTMIGGTPPYSYTWSPNGVNTSSATNLSPGTYTVAIRDANNCALTETLTITGPSASLISTTSQTNNLCGNTGGGATAIVSGGTAPYNYTWSPTGGNAASAVLVSGVYTVNVRDFNNCTTSSTVNILQSSSLTLVSSIKQVSCNGAGNGSATVTVSGGIGPYTYTWSPSGGNSATASNLNPGTYTLSATDASLCSTSTVITITEPAALAITPSQTNIICNGGTGIASVALTGGVAPYTYTWTPSGGNAASATLTAGNYTVSVRDASLCAITQTFSFTQPVALGTTATQTNVLCNGVSSGAASVAILGGVTPYTYTWSPSGGNAASASGLAAGNYTVVAKDNNACTVTVTYTIAQPPALASSMLSTSVSCNGQSTGAATVNVSGGVAPYSYTWTLAGGNASVAASLPANTYTVRIADANGCTRNPTVTISQPPVLASTLTQSNVSCFGLSDGTATISASGGVAPYTYTWQPSGATTTSVSSLTAGNYSITVEDANHCLNLKTFTVISPAQFTIAMTSASVLCNGQNSGSASVTVQGGTPAYSYTWLPAGGNGSVAPNLVVGDYTVTIRDAHNCAATRTVGIVGPFAISGVINSTPANCGASDGTASVSISGGTGNYTYSWTPSGGTSSIASVSAGQYTCTVSDQNNCKLILTTTVGVINPSVSVSSGSNAICSGSSTTITATGSASYTWSPASSLSSSTGSQVTASPTITTTYTITGANMFGCTVTNTIQIQLFVDPDPILSVINGNMCLNSVLTLSAMGGSSYTWTPATGLSNAFVSSPTATLSSAVIYTVKAENAIGCTGTSTISLSPLPLPAVTVSASASSVCVNDPVALTAGGATTYTWNNNATANPLGLYPTASANYTVTGTGPNGCTNTATVFVTVNPLPNVSISSGTSACQGETVTLTASGASTYSWSSGDAVAAIAVSPSITSAYTVTGTDANGCVDTADFTLTVFATPVLNVSGKREACRNERLTYSVTGGATYTWSTGDQTSSITYAFTTNTVITVSSAVGTCPPGVSTLTVAINALPTLTLSASSTVLNSGQSAQLDAASSETQYLWTPSTGLSCNTCSNPVAQPAASTVYTVEVTNKKGCKVTETVAITVDYSCGELFAPSAFSPNEDGNNDTWCVYGNCIESIHVEVFNRWGQKVFSSDDKNQCWDGKLNGVMQNPGVFIFQAQTTLTNGESKSLKGNVTLIR